MGDDTISGDGQGWVDMSNPATFKKSSVVTATIFTLFTAITKVAAFARHQKKWRGIRPRHLFYGFLVVVLNRVNVGAITTMLVLHVSVIGHHNLRH